ncbi:GDP-mannose 4,6-dehydratase, partial [bacterium]|nr:GDP-mannose 4,6-dehydratase [bacterium]
PLFMTNALDDKELPIYGDGKNIRDWLHVLDNCEAIEMVMERGKDGQVYNIGAGNERTNLEITDFILQSLNKPKSLQTFIEDRKGHDHRYALNTNKIKGLGWNPCYSFETAIQETILWYQHNRWWWEKIKSGKYLEYYKQHYKRYP